MHLLQQNKLPKEAILSSRESISELFERGTSFVVHPLRATVLFKTRDEHLECDENGGIELECLFVVSKRFHRRAVRRNVLRRRIKESHRLSRLDLLAQLNHSGFTGELSVAISYVTTQSHDYQIIADATKKIHQRLVDMATSGAY